MMFATAYSQLHPFDREFVDGCISALERENERRFERLTTTLERFSQGLDLDTLDERTRDQFNKPMVRAAIRERVEAVAAERDLTHARVIKEHAAIAVANINRFFKVGEDGLPIFDAKDCTDVDWAAVQQVDVEEEYSRGKNIRKVKIKLYNKQASLDTLAKFMGMDKADNPEYAAYKTLPADLVRLESSATLEALQDEYARFIDG
ncbi:terminase small subunit protein [Rhizobium phage RHph_X2_24]|nr:terminase small subunit protein [Rhizobium phage RHph_X2_24]